MPEGQLRKFTNPMSSAAASSPAFIAPADAIVRRGVLNRGTLRGDKFVFNVEKLKAVNFFCRGVTIPGLNMLPAIARSQTHDVPKPGDKVMFDPLIIQMAVAEDFENVLEIQRWIRALGFPEGHFEHRFIEKAWQSGETSDASASIMTNAGGLEQIRVHFQDAFPASIGGIRLGSDLGEATDEIIVDVTFFYSMYRIELIPEGSAN